MTDAYIGKRKLADKMRDHKAGGVARFSGSATPAAALCRQTLTSPIGLPIHLPTHFWGGRIKDVRLADEILNYLTVNPGASGTRITDALRKGAGIIAEALDDLFAAGKVDYTDGRPRSTTPTAGRGPGNDSEPVASQRDR
jgi:hypothetical protein